ncbi:uncharacterized protein C1orf87-like isoform X1 [Podarcis raffonei]|uniref:uncharacterized protein C1orf87-like isoform X1 n=1 Tax=Podarcis raffonei TaxID=65483 RepID=UPI0023293F94|nr:uncharacterized protein C1orf87-like isoform X1 [Podarcis raffonei]XP_053238620.1 uncharacterized protein C1orf87-like isoform X1 [Podarcis raffonei]
MASVRNIPYGFNANYETVIKIIGSKYVRCLVEKTDGKAKEGVKTETQSMLRTLAPHNARQAHRNPPGLNRPPCQQIHYGLRDEQQNKGEKEEQKSKQGETSDSRSVDNKGLKPLNTHCVTAPSGDKSLSYIHTLQKPSMETQILKQLERQQDINQKPMDEENDSLLGILRKELEQCPLNLTTLEKLQEECKVLDPRVSRLLSQAQLSHLLLKYEVPLQLPTVKLLFKRFSKANDQELVNYEKLLQFLMPVAASKTQQTQALPRKSQNMENHCKSSWTPEDAFQALKQTLKEHKGELSLQDKTCSGLLSPSETEIICKKHGLTLSTGILEALVSTCEFGKRGKIEWKTFVEFLKKVQAGINPALLVCRRGNKEKNEDDSQDKEWSNRCAGKTWEQMKEVTYDSIDAEEQDAWIDRFRKLERALYLCDVKNTGKLEKEKAKRLIHNYNQIYDLCLSPLKIDKAFRPFRPGQDITLEPLLDYLKEL